MNPITLAASNGRYTVIAGHRRLAALRKLGLTTAPATAAPCGSSTRPEITLRVSCAKPAAVNNAARM